MIINDLYNSTKTQEVISVVSNEEECKLIELLTEKMLNAECSNDIMSLAIAYEKICSSQNERTRILYGIKDRIELFNSLDEVHDNG